MNTQRTKIIWAALAVAVIVAMGAVSKGDAEEYRQSVLAYCEGVAVFEADKARGVPLENRVGHRDWRDDINVAEDCPGLRPAR